ncbi:hypothetical protein HanXRQr2_Chr17g0781081 [Helianthus annuus]|uniref:Uncharacterized protein n=1 Tax=Helianthus annuus TaxID=4232 RepID=A0A9K3DDS1_HELAN|nr:hypothetical protein HanXRQr2_Chr17g0781081 [Helianthus annuus]KAJ0811311.1 hypothetical protein HanPSC8_Chr17g0749321 [Helianthus annuus]
MSKSLHLCTNAKMFASFLFSSIGLCLHQCQNVCIYAQNIKKATVTTTKVNKKTSKEIQS